MQIGTLVPVDLRELWKHEERGFSAWLEQNLDRLSEAIGVSLSDPQRESRAGTFQVDLVAEDEEGERVIVENQLEATDHDHLGKLITYLANLDAKTAVWITSAPRAEHIRAMQWLNETTPDNVAFFLVSLVHTESVLRASSAVRKDCGSQCGVKADWHRQKGIG